MENAYRHFREEEERSREKRKLGSNSAIFPGKGEPNFNNLNCESFVLDWHRV